MTDLTQTQKLIAEECDKIKALLIEKNRAYGDSAISPVRVFSKADPIEQLKVRLDDKLSRLVRGEAAGEDVEGDLMGYLVLLRVARRLAAKPSAKFRGKPAAKPARKRQKPAPGEPRRGVGRPARVFTAEEQEIIRVMRKDGGGYVSIAKAVNGHRGTPDGHSDHISHSAIQTFCRKNKL